MSDEQSRCPHCSYPAAAHGAGDDWTDVQIFDVCLADGMAFVKEARQQRAAQRRPA